MYHKWYYFSVIKLCCLLLLIAYFIIEENKSIAQLGLELFLLACFLSISVLHDIWEHASAVCLLLEALPLILLIFLYGEAFLILSPMAYLDMVVYFHGASYLYFVPYALLLFLSENWFLYMIFTTFTIIVYLQQYKIIASYQEFSRKLEKDEYKLKGSMEQNQILYRKELMENSLYFETKLLEEKDMLSQVLHDKLGHNINGSLYQLEAAKMLTEAKPKESIRIIQSVIDALRGSMDEIRDMLKKERPDKKRMTLLHLQNLCKDCNDKYGIQAEIHISGDDKSIPDTIWEIILDNTYEAVSNALKYAKCKNIGIDIVVLNKVVRCRIVDDGIGADSIMEGMGISGMKQRVRKIGGTLDITSYNGFSIQMILPFED